MVKIRYSVIEDAAALADLSSQFGYPKTYSESTDRISAILSADDHTIIVACLNDGTIVGWVHLFLALRVQSEPFAELGGLIVSEQYRNQGIGSRLIAAA